MITGIGVDIVQIARLVPWVHNPTRLRKVFTDQEIAWYNTAFQESLTSPTTASFFIQRQAAYWAVRFAAKEAFFKAWSASLVTLKIPSSPPLLFVCQQVIITKTPSGVPTLSIAWEELSNHLPSALPPLMAHLSLSHEKQYAIAYVSMSLKIH